MNIAEKLGIKPIYVWNTVCSASEAKELEQQRNELLEAYLELLIEAINNREQTHGSFRGGPEKYYQEDIKIIEKADPQHRPWSEIKELI